MKCGNIIGLLLIPMLFDCGGNALPELGEEAQWENQSRASALSSTISAANDLAEHHWRQFRQALERIWYSNDSDNAASQQLTTDGAVFLEKQKFIGTIVEFADCRGVLCKILLRHENSQSAENFRHDQRSASGPWEGWQFAYYSDDNQFFETTIYFAPFKHEQQIAREITQLIHQR